MSKIEIIGYGHVGKAMVKLFPTAHLYDPNIFPGRERPKGADLALVCVPTPRLDEGGGADVSIVEEVVRWCDARVICLKSTVPPGTTERLARETGKRVVFSPEYEGETPWQRGARDWPYVIAGGERGATDYVLGFFQAVLGPDVAYWTTDATTAELVKYMENAWLAAQVTFANEFSEIANAVGADYKAARELWALDPRVSRSHTLVFRDAPGFDGKCLPKDLDAIISCAEEADVGALLLRAIRAANARFRR